jgi:hypothetical protein
MDLGLHSTLLLRHVVAAITIYPVLEYVLDVTTQTSIGHKGNFSLLELVVMMLNSMPNDPFEYLCNCGLQFF